MSWTVISKYRIIELKAFNNYIIKKSSLIIINTLDFIHEITVK